MENHRDQNNGAERPTRTSSRGFAAMDPEYQRQIAREGGRIAHERGVAHKWTSEEAREAGRKGGQNSKGRSRERNSPSGSA
jgi:general stress protein YciG